MSPTPPPHELVPALVAESAKKSRVCWLSWPGAPAHRLVWHVWHADALVVLSAGPDQQLPGIEAAATAEVTMRSKDTGGRLLTWVATVEVVDPGAPAWEEHARALLGVRLNLVDPAATLQDWRAHGTVVRLVPVDVQAPRSPMATAPPMVSVVVTAWDVAVVVSVSLDDDSKVSPLPVSTGTDQVTTAGAPATA